MTPPRHRLAADDGFAMIAAIAVLALVLVLTGVTVVQALSSSETTVRDTRLKAAGQAADAGIRAAIYRMNSLDATNAAQPCVAVNGDTLSLVAYQTVADEIWCPPVPGDVGGGATYSYRVAKAVQVNGTQVTRDSTIVSTGTVGGVSRRVAVKVSTLTGLPLFGINAIITQSDLTLPNSVDVQGNVRSDGTIKLTNSATVCGNATPGPGRVVTSSSSGGVCAGYSTDAADRQLEFTPVDQGNAATVNDNARICGADPCSSKGVSWNPTTRRLSISTSGNLTLGGNIYSFCDLSLSNSATLNIAPRDPNTSLRIYIDSPEHCGGTGGNVNLANSSLITNQNTNASSLQIYLLGSPSKQTSVSFSNSSSSDLRLVIYAPLSQVTLSNSVQLTGAIAAKSVSLSNSVKLTFDTSVSNIQTTSVTPLFRPQQYRECTPSATAGTGPAQGC
jgi:type II secretory pathway pseudopilin PulG